MDERIQMLIDNIFQKIVEMNSDYYTKRDFSKNYLGKCETYYSAMNSKKEDVSKTALINLFKKLKREEEILSENYKLYDNNYMRDNMMKKRAALKEMSDEVLNELVSGARV